MREKKKGIRKRNQGWFEQKKPTSAPLWVYIALLGFSMVSIVISACLYFCENEQTTRQTFATAGNVKQEPNDIQNGGQANQSASTEPDKKEQPTKKSWWQNFFQNLGFGVLGSLVCSCLIDIGNTRRAKREAKDRTKHEIGILADNIIAAWEPVENIKTQYETSEKKLFSFSENGDQRDYPVQLRSMICSQLSRMSEACARMKEYLEREGEDKKRDTLYKNVQKLIESSAKFVLEVASVDHGQEANASDVQKDLLSLYACMGKAINGLKPANADKTKA